MTHHRTNAPSACRDGVTFAAMFFLLFAALYFAWSLARGTSIERFVIDYATVQPSVAIINAITPLENVTAQGHRLMSPRARLSVLNGCEGTECLLLLIAAVLAFRGASWRHKALGLLAGFALVYISNQLRIVALFYTFRFERGWFETLHGYLAPTLIVALSCLFFLWWASRAVQTEARREPVAAS